MTAMLSQEIPLALNFNTLCDHRQPHALCQSDKHLRNRRIGQNVPDEALVDLELIQMKSL